MHNNKKLKDLLRNGARKTPSQQILIWRTVPYGLEIIMQCSPYFKKYFETPCIK